MTNHIAQIIQWLCDLHLAGALLLAAALAIALALPAGARRIRIGWGAAIGLLILAVVTAIPGRPALVHLGAFALADDRIEQLQPMLEPTPRAAARTIVVPAPNNYPDVRPIARVEERRLDMSRAAIENRPDKTAPISAKHSPKTGTPRNGATQPAKIARTPLSHAAIDWPRTVLAAYLFGAAAICLWSLVGWVTVIRVRRATQTAGVELVRLLESIAHPVAPPRILVSDRLPHAVALGIVRPAIIVPAELAERGDARELEAILRHEYAHITNRDLWQLALLRMLLGLFYCQPLFWVLRRMVRDSQELLADQAAAGEQRAEYAEQLLRWARTARSRYADRMIAVAGMFKRSERLSRRIAALVDDHFPVESHATGRARIAIVATIALLTTCGALLTLGSANTEEVINEAHSASEKSPLDPMGSPAAPVNVEKSHFDGVFHGVVVDRSNRPQPGVRVALYIRPNGSSVPERALSPLPELATATTDASGQFTFPPVLELVKRLPAELRADKRGLQFDVLAQAEGKALASTHAEAGKSIELRLGDARRVSGRIVDDAGNPLAGVTVRVEQLNRLKTPPIWDPLTGETPNRGDDQFVDLRRVSDDLLSATTDAEGNFTIAGLPADRLVSLVADHPDYVRWPFFIATTDKSQADVGLTLAGAPQSVPVATSPPTVKLARGGALELTFTLADTGKPAVGTTVDPGPIFGDESIPVDQSGRVTLKQLWIGKHNLAVAPPVGSDYLGSYLADIELTNDSLRIERTIALPRGATVAGRVLDARTGKGIADVPIFAMQAVGEAVQMIVHRQVRTDADGNYRMTVSPGEGIVAARGTVPGYRLPRDYRAGDKNDVRADKTSHAYKATLDLPATSIDLLLEPAPVIPGRVVGPDGTPLGGVMISTTRDPRGGSNIRTWTSSRSSPVGGFALDGLFTNTQFEIRNEYLVAAIDEERKLGKVQIFKEPQADAGGNIPPITIQLEPLQKTTGRVLDEKGKPVHGAKVVLHQNLFENSSQRVATTETDADGQYAFDVLLGGVTYYVSAARKGERNNRVTAVVQDGVTPTIELEALPTTNPTPLPSLTGLSPEAALAALSEKFPTRESSGNERQYEVDLQAYSRAFLKLAKEHPKTEVAFGALTKILDGPFLHSQTAQPIRAAQRQAGEILRTDFITRPELAKYVDRLIHDDNKRMREAIRQLVEGSPHREIVGRAKLSLFHIEADSLRWGFSQSDAARQKCVQILEEIIRDYGDVKLHENVTLGSEAAKALREMQFYTAGATPREIVGPTLDGGEMKLSDYRGKVVLLWFWAYWSTGGSTAEHIARMNQIADRLKGKPFALLGVALDPPAEARAYAQAQGATWPSWADGERGPISTEWNCGGNGVFLIDHRGVIRQSHAGFHNLEDQVLNLVQAAQRETAAAMKSVDDAPAESSPPSESTPAESNPEKKDPPRDRKPGL